jgi:hypothetical protein
MKGTLKLIGSIFGLVGLVLLAVGAWFAVDAQRFVAGATRSEGVVVAMEGSDTLAPVVEFTAADGRTVQFRSSLSSSPPSYSVGERVGVYYDIEAPDDARIDAFMDLWFATLVLSGMGSVFGAVGFFTLYLPWRRARIAKALRQHGRALQATFDRVELDTSFAVNDRNPWRIHVRWLDPDTGERRDFRSEHLWEDPTGFVPEQVTVFVDPRKPSRYHVDVSYLPELMMEAVRT